MTRKDFELLARVVGHMLARGELSRGGLSFMASELDTACAHFNQGLFETAVNKIAGEQER